MRSEVTIGWHHGCYCCCGCNVSVGIQRRRNPSRSPRGRRNPCSRMSSESRTFTVRRLIVGIRCFRQCVLMKLMCALCRLRRDCDNLLCAGLFREQETEPGRAQGPGTHTASEWQRARSSSSKEECSGLEDPRVNSVCTREEITTAYRRSRG